MIFFTVLIAGGSRGARTINTAMIDVHKHFQGKRALSWCTLQGMGNITLY